MPLEIYEEIKEGPDDQTKDLLFAYMQDEYIKRALVLDETVLEENVRHAIYDGYAEDLTDDEVDLMARDPFLLAYALVDPENRCIVTAEQSKPKKTRANRKIPDVCKTLGLRSCDIFGLIKDLGFHTGWEREKGGSR